MRILLVLAVLASIALSCRHSHTCVNGGDARYAATDSQLAAIQDVDSLAVVASRYHDQCDAVGEMLALRHQGRRLRQQSRYDEALHVLDRGLEVATLANDTVEMAMILVNQGDVQRRLGELSQANGLYYRALMLCEDLEGQQSPRVMKVTALTLNSIGNIEMDLCNYVAADSVLRRALAIERELGCEKGMAVNYFDLGQVKTAIDEIDSAWYYYRESMDYHERLGNDKGVAMCHYRYGELYEETNDYSRAVNEYATAYDQLKTTGDSWQWLKPCLALARIHVLMGEKEKAQSYIHEGEVEARRIGSKAFLADVYMTHYELSLLQGNPDEALQHYIRGTELHDSIYGLKMNDKMRAQRIAYQNSRKSGEVNVLNRDLDQLKRSRNTQSLLGMMLLLMAAAIIIALLFAVLVRMKTQRLMRQIEETRSLFFTL